MTRSRRTFTAQEKATIVKRYLFDKIPVSDLCDELGQQPTQIYQWQKQLFDNAHAAFAKTGRMPKKDDKLLGKECEFFTSRDQKLEAAREKRRERRQQQAA